MKPAKNLKSDTMQHLSFQIFQYEGFNFSGIFCQETNRLYCTKKLKRKDYKRLISGKVSLQKIGGIHLSIQSDCVHIGEDVDLKLFYA